MTKRLKFDEGWTKRWSRFTKKTLAAIPNKSGTYVIQIENKHIKRIMGTDADGIIVIGKAASLRSRLRKFYRCATEKGKEGHYAGWNYNYRGYSTKYKIKSERLRFRYILSKDIIELYRRTTLISIKEAASLMESRKLLEYISYFGETPPLNNNVNWKSNKEKLE